jgi:type I restriction enzyme R subunit
VIDAESWRAISEALTEVELALFDILSKPEPKLSKAEEIEAKKVAKELLAKLKRERLVLDWRDKMQTKAAVQRTIKQTLRALPSVYTPDILKDKQARTYAHVFESYFGDGKSVY